MAMPFPDLPTDVGPQPLDDEDLQSVVLAATFGTEDALRPAVVAFVVDDDAKAEWCMRHVRRLAGRLDAAKAQHAQWVAELNAWLVQQTAELAAQRAFFEDHLIRYQVGRRKADPRAKTLRLPSGEVTSTEKKPAVDVGDQEALLTWLDENVPADLVAQAEAVKVERKVLLTGLRKLLALDERDDGDGTYLVVQPAVIADPESGEKLWPSDELVEALEDEVPGTFVRSAALECKVKPRG